MALLLAALIGAEAVSPRGAVPFAVAGSRAFRALPNLYVPVQLGIIVWAVAVARQADAMGFAALALSVGVTTGVFGMLAAHELVHGHSRPERALGLAMLSGMTYRHFRVAHIFGHHRWRRPSATPATAQAGRELLRLPPAYRGGPVPRRPGGSRAAASPPAAGRCCSTASRRTSPL
ncbi:MAG: fatty acid desaturase [Rhizomicrobium sp.]